MTRKQYFMSITLIQLLKNFMKPKSCKSLAYLIWYEMKYLASIVAVQIIINLFKTLKLNKSFKNSLIEKCLILWLKSACNLTPLWLSALRARADRCQSEASWMPCLPYIYQNQSPWGNHNHCRRNRIQSETAEAGHGNSNF